MFDFFGAGTRRAAAMVAVCAAAAATGACDDDGTSPPDPVLWEAELASNVLAGLVDVSAQSNGFTAAIGIEDAAVDAVFTWHIAEGTCAVPGDRIGAATIYPELEVAADGTAEAEATVAFGLEDDGDYIAEVFADDEGEAVQVACGALALSE